MSVEFNYDLEIPKMEDFITLNIVAEYRLERDVFGEDADGNRGESRIYAEITTLVITNEKDEDITEMIEKKFTGDYDKIVEQAEERASEVC